VTSTTLETDRPFKVAPVDGDPFRRSLMWAARPAVERILRFPTLNKIYEQVCAAGDDEHFADRSLDALGVAYHVDRQELDRIPREGSVVIVANHPFGGIEGLILLSLLRRVRPDVKLLANQLLSIIPDLRDSFLFVDPFGSRDAVRSNIAAIRGAMQWVSGGHILGVFPSGEVSHLKLRPWSLADPAWHSTAARIIERTGAAVVPVFFDGRNGNLFQLLGLIHPRLRTMMLPTEMLRMRKGTVEVRVGSPIGRDRLKRFTSLDDLTSFLRVRTYLLRTVPADTADRRLHAASLPAIVDPMPAERIADELAALPPKQKLLSHGEFDIYYARARQVPAALREIGRLREIAFRKVGEGSGRAIDLDGFDRHYLHVFVFDRGNASIVGAYRLGQTDKILRWRGIDALYTNTLFRFKRSLLEQISPALELGRSFVRPEYQRSFTPLLLLWRGVCTYCVRHPRYRNLIGPVSISAEYNSMSKLLLVRFFEMNRLLPDLARKLRPRNPHKLAVPRDFDARAWSTVVRDLDEVNQLVADLESDGKPMPVLLRQYMKMNARLIGFNVDPEFGNVLDGLMLCDLTQVSPAILHRYMGKPGYESFMAYHGAQPPSE
jgi:putative hemolysin